MEDLNLVHLFLQQQILLYNDKKLCMCWSQILTTNGLCHLQMRENIVRKFVLHQLISVLHIGGKINPADIFTKEDKDFFYFLTIQDQLLSPPPTYPSTILDNSNTWG